MISLNKMGLHPSFQEELGKLTNLHQIPWIDVARDT